MVPLYAKMYNIMRKLTFKCHLVGCMYWPKVTQSTPVLLKSANLMINKKIYIKLISIEKEFSVRTNKTLFHLWTVRAISS